MDLFISYRRDTGGDLAALVNEKFTQKGIETFFDRDNIHNVDFWEKIKRGIDQAPNFLMILSPGYFLRRENEEDYVRKEILYALEKGKNLLAIATRDYDPAEIDWEYQIEQIQNLRTFDYKLYPHDGNQEMVDAFLRTYINAMKSQDGSKFSLNKKIENNSWYSNHEMNDEDFLWIKTDHIVCRSLDWEILEQAILEKGVFDDRQELNLLCYKAYDIETYRKKYDLNPKSDKKNGKKITNVFGVTYEELIEKANEIFGVNHFIPDSFDSENYVSAIESLIVDNGLNGFDIIDLTLIIKDLPDPEKVVRDLVKYLNPNGGIIYIRELDDDYIDGYPDGKDYIKKLKSILDLDEGAGNRHTGKKIYTFLKRAGAEKVYIADKIISTANHKSQFQQKIFETYFSYLRPELRALAFNSDENKNNPKYEKYVEAYEWLEENYSDIESTFCSQDFYFRAGYVAGYGVFKQDPDLE